MMMDELKSALSNDRIEEIVEIRNKVRNVIEEKISIKPHFEIKRDPFCEGNHVTDGIRNILLKEQRDSESYTVAAGR